MSNDNADDLRAKISAAQEAQKREFPDQDKVRIPTYTLSTKLLVLKEYILHIAAAGFIGYVLDTLFSYVKQDSIFPFFTAIIMPMGLLAATYRSWRILKGLNPDG